MWVSAVPGSVKVPLKPSVSSGVLTSDVVVPAEKLVMVGGTLVTLTVTEAVSHMLPSSVALTETA